MSERTIEALVVAAIWVGVALALRWGGRRAFRRWMRSRSPEDAARQRTLLTVLERLVLTLVFLLATWSVLSTFQTTAAFGRALLASGAVIAVFAGAALSTPLGNLGAGLIVGFAQPVRLGDRVTVGDATGTVEEIGLVYTVLVTDDNRRVYLPNTQLTSSVVVNRTVRDPRRTITADLPLPVTASIERARAAVLASLATLPGSESLELTVRVGQITERTVWLNVSALAPPATDPAVLGSDVRERALAGLCDAGLLDTD